MSILKTLLKIEECMMEIEMPYTELYHKIQIYGLYIGIAVMILLPILRLILYFLFERRKK